MSAPDLYAVMGVPRTASADEIKQAYRRESLVRHPDRGGTKEAFQELQMAHEILRDPAKRAEYDATGRIPGAAEDSGGGAPGPDLSEVLGSMFGGGGGGFPFFGMGGMMGGGGPAGKAPRGPNKVHEIGISMVDLYHGKTIKLNMHRDVLCAGCKGKGGKIVETCDACKGRGMRVRGQQMGPMITMIHEPCAACQQTGTVVRDKCGDCGGRRVVERESVLEVKVEPGMQEGDRIVFPGACSESPMFEAPGDVILVIRAAATDSECWTRHGADLVLEVNLTLAEAMLGWERTVSDHPSGRPLRLVWKDGVVREGDVLTVDEWGMPVRGGSGKGVLRLVCRVAKQDTMWSEEQRRILLSVWPEWREPVESEGDVKPRASVG